jgi:FtsZ-binding cell division protein ZapB
MEKKNVCQFCGTTHEVQPIIAERDELQKENEKLREIQNKLLDRFPEILEYLNEVTGE